jgi:hypothetical protein
VPEGKYTINLIPDPESPSQRVGPTFTPKPGSGIQSIYWFVNGRKAGSTAWGSYRARLDPAEGTNTFGRNNFYIHNSQEGRTMGCVESVEVPGDLASFRNRNPGVPFIEVQVDYAGPNASTNGKTNWKENR